MTDKKNIVLHDIFDIRGGGERLAMSMVTGLGADLCYGSHSLDSFDLSGLTNTEIYDLKLRLKLKGAKTYALSKLFKNKTQFLKRYQNVIYSGIVCPLAINNHPDGQNYYYCHTPPRFVYDKFQYYMDNNNWVSKQALRSLVTWYKKQYEDSVSAMDLVFSNSKFVQNRVKKYLKRDSIVIYPPCRLERFRSDQAQGYYLSTARFDKLKRVDLIIKAFLNMPDKKLLVCSHGVEEQRLKLLTKDSTNIQFTGQVSDENLIGLISQSIATIYIPKDEDFGMSPVESMASGKPVICSNHGGPTESVVNHQTGLYVDEENIVESLCENVNKLNVNLAESMRDDCLKRAEFFSEEKFHLRLNKYVN